MKTKATAFFAALFSITLWSFSPVTQKGLNVSYGVTSSDPSQIELNLNEDYTFTYQDFSNPDNKISVSGSYELNGRTVKLNATESTADFHHRWKIKEEGNVATSRLGMCFYRLRKL